MNRTKIALLVIVIFAAFLRLYKLDSIPPSLNWDEVNAGYNAYTIANWGRDEWGQFLPLVFTSFKDDKHPVHIYLAAPFVKIFGLSGFTTRLPGAIIGILSIFVIFFLARILFKSDLAAIFSALFLAISPYHLFFSRGLWEMNFAIFFFMLGLLLFYLAFYKKWLIILSFLCFGISILSYHSSKIVVPPVILLLLILYFGELKKLRLYFYLGIVVIMAFIIMLLTNPRILGFARVKQTEFSKDKIENTQTYKKTGNYYLSLGEIIYYQYISHFSSDYLFISGDQNPRNSVKTHGEFYTIDALFLFVGIIYLLKMRSRVTLVIFSWLILSPLPSSLVTGAPNATRAVFMLGSMQLVSALGASCIVGWARGRGKFFVLVIITILLGVQTYKYLDNYLNIFPTKDQHDWQYGMKQVVEFVSSYPEYGQVFVTDVRSQPYIFFLFYLKTALPDYLNTVIYNNSDSKSYSLVSSFDKYYFGGWDPIESMPYPGVLYVLTSNQYDGLRHKSEFDVRKVIRYPDGTDTFYLVTRK